PAARRGFFEWRPRVRPAEVALRAGRLMSSCQAGYPRHRFHRRTLMSLKLHAGASAASYDDLRLVFSDTKSSKNNAPSCRTVHDDGASSVSASKLREIHDRIRERFAVRIPF